MVPFSAIRVALGVLDDDLDTQLAGPGDTAVRRVLGLVTTDVDNDLRGGSAQLAATLRDDDAIGSASSTTLALDQAFRIT